MIRVALIDDQALFRAGISMVMSSQPDMEMVAEASDGSEAVELVETHHPDVILMDVRMPVVDGVEATRRVVEKFGEDAPKVLIFTTFDLDDAVTSAIEAGASGFLLKETRPEMLLETIRAVADGSQVVAAGATKALFENTRPRRSSQPGPEFENLTAREREVMLLAATGMSNAEIAAHEFVSEATVKTHISRTLAKLQLRDRVQLVVYAYEHGLL